MVQLFYLNMNYTSEKYEQVWTLMYKILNALSMVTNGLR